MAFSADIFEYLNKLNTELQGRNQYINDSYEKIKQFKLKLHFLAGEILRRNLEPFPGLVEFGTFLDLTIFSNKIYSLYNEFNERFADFAEIEKDLLLFSHPFLFEANEFPMLLIDEIIQLKEDENLKNAFMTKTLLEFYTSLDELRFPYTRAWAQEYFVIFSIFVKAYFLY